MAARILGKYAKAASTVFPLFDYVPADLVTLFVSNMCVLLSVRAHLPLCPLNIGLTSTRYMRDTHARTITWLCARNNTRFCRVVVGFNSGAHAPSYVYRMLSEYYDEADTE